MKKASKVKAKSAIVVIFALAAIAFLKVLLTMHCEKTNSLISILIDMNTGTVFFSVLIWPVLLILCSSDSFRLLLTNLRDAIRSPFFKYFLLGGLIILFIPQLFPFTRQFGYIKINGKKPIRLQYNYALLCDAISSKTETLTLDAEDFELEIHNYYVGGRYAGSHRHIAPYACFAGKSVYLYNNSLSSYIRLCQTYQKQLEIVYYKNSGIIQSINGINIYDERTFLESADAIKLEESRKLEEQKAAEEEEKEKQVALFSAFFESEGKNYEEIVRQLSKDGLENTYKTVYISTRYYKIGDIAMFDNMQQTVYVVRDNYSEDMLLIPPIPKDGTLAEITKILDDAGISWTYDCCESITEKENNRDHSRDVLNSYSRSPGTPVPKDYVFWFSVHHVGE